MSDPNFETVSNRLRAIDSRRQKAEVALWLPRGLLAGLLLAALVAAMARFRPILSNREVAVVAGMFILICMALTLGVLLVRRRVLFQQARFADSRLGLQERATTAVEIASGRLQTTPLLATLQLADTAGALGGVEIEKALPLRVARGDLALLALGILLLSLAIFLPNPQADILEQRRNIEKSIAEQAAALEALEEQIQSDPDLSEAQQVELLEPLQSALEELEAGDISRERAVAALSEAEAELRELGAASDPTSLLSTLEEAAAPLGETTAGASLAGALGRGDLAAASAQAFQLADRLPELSPDALSDLAQSLAETAAALEEVDPELAAELSEVAGAIRDGDLAAAQEALRQAGSTLQQRFQEQAASRRATAAADQLADSRAAVAQADEPGQPGQGEGQGQGAAQGQSSPGGQAAGEGSGQGAASALDQGEGAGGPGPGGGHSERVYVPERVDLSDAPGESVELPAECLANPNDCGALISETDSQFGDEQSLIPYDQVFGDYRDAAYQAMDDNYVPLGLKTVVRDYFSSLEP